METDRAPGTYFLCLKAFAQTCMYFFWKLLGFYILAFQFTVEMLNIHPLLRNTHGEKDTIGVIQIVC